MAYLGRLVGVGLTKNNRPCGVYAVSGRSEMSKKRIAEIKYPAVIIGPSEKLTPRTGKDA
jgi:IMP cyclohydrolase